jgi:hypothetical protein
MEALKMRRFMGLIALVKLNGQLGFAVGFVAELNWAETETKRHATALQSPALIPCSLTQADL